MRADRRPPFTNAPLKTPRLKTPLLKNVPPEHSERTLRLLQVYGRIGTRLLHRSDLRDGRDCLRLAVIAQLRGWSQEALQWLHRAGEAGQTEAVALLHDARWEEAAVRLAYRYGREYLRAEARRTGVAMFFFRLAAEKGHAEAAYELGVAHQKKGEDWEAAIWFRRAAAKGHPSAATKFGGAAQQLARTPWTQDGVLPLEVMDMGAGWAPPEGGRRVADPRA
ncbi:sel1 repeat family protein [Nonomuraea pusilla]|uniref:Sel1 repeat-containing protein n=1 Tax=Nonomuraea pusilla TaxID=46177 RepID=A0A1H7KM89_9ACTN|nr:sel1 repeat family protein [Nonomuraea pusilla]SEK87892.1 hypothetical protein SAMN05660976_01303 [Nonomuraea pusilla]